MALLGPRASRMEDHKKQVRDVKGNTSFKSGLLTMVAYGKLFCTTKWPVFKEQVYGPFRDFRERHARYVTFIKDWMPFSKRYSCAQASSVPFL